MHINCVFGKSISSITIDFFSYSELKHAVHYRVTFMFPVKVHGHMQCHLNVINIHLLITINSQLICNIYSIRDCNFTVLWVNIEIYFYGFIKHHLHSLYGINYLTN